MSILRYDVNPAQTQTIKTSCDSRVSQVVQVRAGVAPPNHRLFAPQVWVIAATIFWTLVDLPLDVITAGTAIEALAGLIACAFYLVLAVGALFRQKFLLKIYLLFTAIGAVALGSELPSLYDLSSVIFGLSAVECAFKSAVILLFAVSSTRNV
ncbi:hypothetical protein K788_00003415 [Paraburkholderia caribensis MBA4]|uniref:Uncharacterized protein n=1 Tax=Paraburkholderia caribensis MBA4 TaxID=1323664 RepID=A0A0N7JV58_9BURK|nr:hypothetical protein [Paraburkholderia caribensis]ALL68293.1 hypothetical protein K788_00003415 [Paraburkholderia caribensis MBA4]